MYIFLFVLCISSLVFSVSIEVYLDKDKEVNEWEHFHLTPGFRLVSRSVENLSCRSVLVFMHVKYLGMSSYLWCFVVMMFQKITHSQWKICTFAHKTRIFCYLSWMCTTKMQQYVLQKLKDCNDITELLLKVFDLEVFLPSKTYKFCAVC